MFLSRAGMEERDISELLDPNIGYIITSVIAKIQAATILSNTMPSRPITPTYK